MNIAIVGATGNVGRKTLEVLEKKELSIDISNISLITSDGQPTRVGFKIENDKIHSLFTLDGEVSLKEFDFKKGDFFTVSKVENIMITAQKSSKLFEISSPIKPSYKTYSN